MIENVIQIVSRFLAVVIILTTHEFAHAFVAYKCGDPTAKFAGRLSLNPMKHFDVLGLILFALVGFGWAKPVPINPYNFKNPRKGYFLTSIAGVLVNFITAFLVYPFFILVSKWIFSVEYITYGHELVYFFTYFLYVSSLSFCVFNLLPLYPLDGFRVVEAIDKRQGKVLRFLRKYGYYILIGLVALSYISRKLVQLSGIIEFGYFDILGFIMQNLQWLFGKPIELFWGLFFK